MGADGGIVAEYDALRSETDADLLAMQVGDFFEFFGTDAELVHDVLDLKLSTKPSGGERYPMAGVPVAEIDRYASALVERGYRVAIATQHEAANGHARDIDRVVTPGTAIDQSDAGVGYLAVVDIDGATVGLALVDTATGRWYADRTHAAEDADALLEVLGGLDLAEVVLSPAVGDTPALERHLDATITPGTAEDFEHRRSLERVEAHFGEGIVDALGLDRVTVTAVGAAIAYLEATDPSLLETLTRLRRYRADDAVTLDATTQRNLELTETFHGEDAGSLLSTIDHTATPAGARQLREWLVRPTRDTDQLERRLDAVEALAQTPLVRDAIVEDLAETSDLERLATRIAHRSATPRDLGLVRETLAEVPAVADRITDSDELAGSAVADLVESLPREALDRVRDTLDAALVDDPPAATTDGGIIRAGWDEDLDELIAEHESLREWFDGLAEREATRHGLESVELAENQTDGYYLQLSDAEADETPEHYEHIKTVAAGPRYRTPDIVENERRFRELDERRAARERAAFEALLDDLEDELTALRSAAAVLAGLDVRCSLATHAVRNDWVRPTFRTDGVTEIDQGRHPVVEQTVRFVPNDVRFDDRRQQLLVTGPNMSGKSTYLRQVALITLLAQVGSFVPADRAAIAPVDGIYTRVGALDELAQGRSTFMVEMHELARILHRATDDSLVILDEVGRGTSTYDGMSIAWATTEYLHNEVGARSLFATHYHELTAMADHLEGVANRHVAVDDTGDDVVFLRTVEAGPTDRSYGIHVADLAGVPQPVVDRADEVLTRLRQDKAVEARGQRSGTTQVVFDVEGETMRPTDESDTTSPDEAAVLAAIEDLDLEATAPLSVVEAVRRWQERLEDA